MSRRLRDFLASARPWSMLMLSGSRFPIFGDAEASGGALFRPLRASAHVRCQVERGRRRRSHGDADVETGGCRSLQAVQSGKARNDARGAGQAGPARERAGNFEHTEGELNDFMHIFGTIALLARPRRVNEVLILNGLVGRAAGI